MKLELENILKLRGVVKKALVMFVGATSMMGMALSVQAATARQVEALNRGLTAVKVNNGVFLSWRLLGTDDYSIAFNVYRDGEKVAGPIANSTNYIDKGGNTNSIYYVRTVVNGVEQTQSDLAIVWESNYLDVPINKPGDTTLNGETVTYTANDATVADVDGDGEYEIILKWNPSNAKDNSESGYTSNVYIDCYEMDGTQRWRIDLGKNIRAGAHYTQFIAYDLNGDGKAEIAMKTADGTKAGDGTIIGDEAADYRNSSGYILSGPEYLTLFEGRTGKILTTIDYTPSRGTVSSWGDKYGNRVDRFLAGVAYLDGKTPSLIIARGYYTRSVVSAYKYKSGALTRQWTFDTNSTGNSSFAGQGNHSLSVADVDNDSYDEIIYGSAVIDHNGKGLYSTGMGHGDALHVGDFDPTHSGMEIFQVHEEKGSSIESVQMRDAATGKTLWAKKTGTDVGRGLIVNIDPDYYPYVAISSAGIFGQYGNELNLNMEKFGINHAIWWDGDLYREGLDRTYINKWNYHTKSTDRLMTADNVHANNGTKYNPSLAGDIFGDWREEVMWPTADDTALRIYTTTDVTDTKLYTFMHDVQYREAIAWQNVGYNQPAHPSYYMGIDMPTPTKPSIYTVGSYSETIVEDTDTVNNSSGNEGDSTTLLDLEDGAVYTIQNVYSGLYLDIVNGSSEDGTNVQQWEGNGLSAQQFKLVAMGDGYYQLLTGCSNYTQAVDVSGGNATDGNNVLTWTDTDSWNQQFKIQKNSDGTYRILTRCSGDASALEVYDFSTESGGNVSQWIYWGGDAQHWRFAKVENSNSGNTDNSDQEATSAYWNFSDGSLSSLGTLSSEVTVDGLTLLANSSKTMEISSAALSLNGINYDYCLRLGGAGNTSYRAMKFSVNGPCTISIVGVSSGSSDRDLILVDENGNTYGTATQTSNLQESTINYTGSSNSLYLYSTNSGINIYQLHIY